MAALGKIRSRGVTLIIIIGLGLFAFIAEEAFRSCNGIKGEARQQIGEVLGEKINVQDFQELVDEYQNAVKFTTQRDNLSDDELNQVKDQVWQQLVSNKIIENDADKLGLTVTDGEIQTVLAEGTNQMLRQTPFINQQTGLFDVNMLKQFLNQYKQAQTSNPQMAEQMETVYNYWLFVEKNLRSQLLQQKYQVLLASCILSNKVEAQMAFKDENEEAQVQLASIAYSTIKDADVKVTDEDLKAKYEELKPAFYQPVETRDLKYVDFQIKASAADRAQLLKEMNGYQKQLATVTDPTQLVSRSTSQVPYLGVPVSSSAFPQDIATKLDSMAVGTTGVYENKQDNTFNIIRIYSKSMLPDSVQFRQIQVAGASIDESRAKADSIQKALAGGAKFEDLAKKYGQTGEKIWFTGAQYEHATSMSQDNKQYIEALLNGEVNATQNLALAQGNVILQVLDKKGMKDKFNAAVIRKVIDFSKATRSKAYNNFSEFVTRSTSLAELQKNASKFGYQVQDLNDFSTAQHNVGGVGGAGIRDAIKWIFSANEGEVSPLFEAGNNDHMLVMVVTHIHPQGYRPYDDPQVKEILTREVIRDKKAEMIMAKLKGVNSIAAAKAKGAKVSTVDQITFASPAFIPATGAAEPAVSGAVAATKAGQFCKKAIKGNAGVYMIQVLKKSMRAGAKFDVNAQMQRNRQQYLQSVGNFMQDLMLQAKVVDNRYLYF